MGGAIDNEWDGAVRAGTQDKRWKSAILLGGNGVRNDHGKIYGSVTMVGMNGLINFFDYDGMSKWTGSIMNNIGVVDFEFEERRLLEFVNRHDISIRKFHP